MTIKVTYSHFLSGNGVPVANAGTIAAAIENKVQKRRPLTRNETILSAAFLNRPGAEPALERSLAKAVERATSRSRIPAHTIEWTDLSPGDPGRTSRQAQTVGATRTLTVGGAKGGTQGVSVQGWNYSKKEVVEGEVRSIIRALADRIAVDSALFPQ